MTISTRTRAETSESSLRIHFVGTGTSTGMPLAPCLAEVDKPIRDVGNFLATYNDTPSDDRLPQQWGGYDPTAPWPSSIACGSCRAAVNKSVPEGWKNRRGNPGLVLRKRNSEGQWRNVVVDVGKTFREQSCRFFPRWGVKSVDAVLITHGHADAYNGLDDLREWCQRQGTEIPIYLTRVTFDTVAKSFPYLVDKTQASGGGDLPKLVWHIIDDESEFEVEGIKVTTLPVHHGRYFNASAGTPDSPDAPPSGPVPFICLGYIFDKTVVYLSDVSSVPERQWARIESALRNRSSEQLPTPIDTPTETNEQEVVRSLERVDLALPSSPPLILIVDSLWPTRTHTSHVSFPQAMDIALRLKPTATYFLGMTHPTTHFMWEEIGRSVKGEHGKRTENADARLASELVKQVWACNDMSTIASKLREWGGQVQPAWDGLGLEVSEKELCVLEHGEGSTGGWDI